MTTGINYLDETWNPVTGCSGKGCKAKCWARDTVNRFPHIHDEHCGLGYISRAPFNRVQFHPSRLDKPLHWRKPRRIGVCFLADWMDDQVKGQWIDDIYTVMMECERRGFGHQFFTLTKQTERLSRAIQPIKPLNNLWNGVSITDQDDDWMIAELLKIPGKHWLSIEPMLGPINYFLNYVNRNGSIGKTILSSVDWVVIGCESGAKRRPCQIEWVESVVEQCRAAGVPVWVKQLDIGGKVIHDINKFPEHLRIREMP